MKNYAALFGVLLFFLFASKNQAHAVTNPLVGPNNKIGIHILFTSELPDAARLVNHNGDWGYVTIPLQITDRDLVKWQTFMNQAKQYHLQPIIRLATEGDYFDTAQWKKPSEADILDFANFLNSLDWPTQNRYVVIFNEVNRADEWNGAVDPQEYAQLLSYAVTVFKSKNPDFFIISAGLDNAAANTPVSMNEYTYLRQMNQQVPGIFDQIDGFSSHSYANPGFSSPPTAQTAESIASFSHEKSLIQSFTAKNLPVFITETGWSKDSIPDTTIASYFQQALSTVWSDTNIVAITPFLLHANGTQFSMFSFFDQNNAPTLTYQTLYNLPKVKGTPILNISVLSDTTTIATNLPLADFSKNTEKEPSLSPAPFKQLFKWLLRI